MRDLHSEQCRLIQVANIAKIPDLSGSAPIPTWVWIIGGVGLGVPLIVAMAYLGQSSERQSESKQKKQGAVASDEGGSNEPMNHIGGSPVSSARTVPSKPTSKNTTRMHRETAEATAVFFVFIKFTADIMNSLVNAASVYSSGDLQAIKLAVGTVEVIQRRYYKHYRKLLRAANERKSCRRTLLAHLGKTLRTFKKCTRRLKRQTRSWRFKRLVKKGKKVSPKTCSDIVDRWAGTNKKELSCLGLYYRCIENGAVRDCDPMSELVKFVPRAKGTDKVKLFVVCSGKKL